MTIKALLAKPKGGHMKRLCLLPFITAHAFVDDLHPILSRQRKEADLPEQSKGSVALEEFLKGELIPEHLRP